MRDIDAAITEKTATSRTQTWDSWPESLKADVAYILKVNDDAKDGRYLSIEVPVALLNERHGAHCTPATLRRYVVQGLGRRRWRDA